MELKPSVEEFVRRVAYYGDLVAVFRGDVVVREGSVAVQRRSLPPDLVGTFMKGEYAQLLSRHNPDLHLYRGFDSRKPAFPRGAGKGVWLSPLRPTFSDEYRRHLAVTHEFQERIDSAVGVKLLPGARIYVGRAARQVDEFCGGEKLLPGWGIQVWVPADELDSLGLSDLSTL
jgi:hypothetical protein